MTVAWHRLRRLARAQGEITKALERRLADEEHKAVTLSAMRAELYTMASEVGYDRLAFLPAALRRLADAESQLRQVLAVIDSLRGKLLSAKGRQKMLAANARLLRNALARKEYENETLEAILTKAAKASGKHDVLS